MKKHLIFSLLALSSVSMFPAFGNEARLLRFPTTNGSEIVFSYAGDLYKVAITGGEAQRLTSHVGYEIFPRFSPDGKTIAFTGQYDGNTEVYTIPANGGEPLRVTYTATNQRDDIGDRMGPNNIVMNWTPDGQRIVYRNRIGDGFEGKLFTVDKEGGLSEVIPLPEGGFCSFSPDGKLLAYNRVMREFRTWKYYKGGMADEIWIYDSAAQQVKNITENEAQDIIPMWIGDEIYFISDRDRTMNLFAYNMKTGQTDKVTHFTEYDIKFPSAHGNTIVFENGGYIYKFDAISKKVEKINISLSSDNIYARGEIKDGVNYLSSASVSPDGVRIAVTARGEVFDVPVNKGVVKNITHTPGAHERGADWAPDGSAIAYISDKTGETEIYLQPVNDKETIQLTKDNDTYIWNFVWSPDARSIVYTDRKNRVKIIDVASHKVTTLFEIPKGAPRDITFSPDNKWLTYTRSAENNINVAYVYNIESRKEYPITDKWYDASSPVFSEDGKYIVLASARDFNPMYGSLEWNHIYKNMYGVYLILLSNETPSPFLGKNEGVKFTTNIDQQKKDKKETTSSEKDDLTVHIDLEGISDRMVRLPIGASYYGNFYAKNDKVYYWGRGGTKMYDLNSKEETVIADGATMTIQPGSDKAMFFRGNQLFVTSISSGKVALQTSVDLSQMKIYTDYKAEWAQIFDEAWRAYRDGFYQETMHGVNWKAMKAKYAVLLPYVKTRLDLNYVIGEMIGELCCGHAYINPGETQRPNRVKTGLLGAEISRDKSGYFKLEKIIPGANWSTDLRSPLMEPGIKAHQGDYIVAIDGVATNSVKNMFELLVGKAGVLTELSLNDKPQLKGARKVVITPLEEEYSLYHYNWVQENIRKVDKMSGGKIGYIYIPDMGPGGLNEFSRYFYPQLDKEGLIIDDRANGGGNVSPMILERLSREPYRLTMGRGTNHIGTVPDAVQVGPKVCLINKYSASDGDLFPWGFRALGLGKLIGTRSWGGIVGISGSLPYMDGTDIRVPFFTSFDPKTGKWIIENHGVDPDILIDNDPVKEWKGEDQQLNCAVEELMKQLKNRKPLPGAPAPRIWSK